MRHVRLRALVVLLLISAAAHCQEMKIQTEHTLVPSVSSPFQVTLVGDYDAVHWWLENGEKKFGQSVTFAPDPGVYVIRVYGLRWNDKGELNPVVKKNGQVLVSKQVAATPAKPKPESSDWQKPADRMISKQAPRKTNRIEPVRLPSGIQSKPQWSKK